MEQPVKEPLTDQNFIIKCMAAFTQRSIHMPVLINNTFYSLLIFHYMAISQSVYPLPVNGHLVIILGYR